MIKLEQILWCMSRASLNKITNMPWSLKSNVLRNARVIKLPIRIHQSGETLRANRVDCTGNFISFWDALGFKVDLQEPMVPPESDDLT